MVDPNPRQELAAAVPNQLRKIPPNGERVGEAEIEFTDDIVRTAEHVISGRGIYTKAELEMVETHIHTVWHNLKADTKDTELRKAVHRTIKKVKRTRTAAVTRGFERYDQEMKQLRRDDQRRLFQHLRSMEGEKPGNGKGGMCLRCGPENVA